MTGTMSDQPGSPASVPPSTPRPGLGWWRSFLRWPKAARITTYVAAGLVLLLVVALVTEIGRAHV